MALYVLHAKMENVERRQRHNYDSRLLHELLRQLRLGWKIYGTFDVFSLQHFYFSLQQFNCAFGSLIYYYSYYLHCKCVFAFPFYISVWPFHLEKYNASYFWLIVIIILCFVCWRIPNWMGKHVLCSIQAMRFHLNI